MLLNKISTTPGAGFFLKSAWFCLGSVLSVAFIFSTPVLAEPGAHFGNTDQYSHEVPSEDFITGERGVEIEREEMGQGDAYVPSVQNQMGHIPHVNIPGGFVGEWAENEMNKAIVYYQKLKDQGRWPKMPKGHLIRPGQANPQIETARRILRLTGDYQGRTSYVNKGVYDSKLVKSVKKFQRRFGLTPSGLIGGQMRRALNITPAQKLAKLRLNLARMQGIKQRIGSHKFVMMNIPSYKLQAVENNQIAIESRVVAGRPDRQTPVIDAHIRAVNLLPKWRVPYSIASRDILPTLAKDPTYFEREHFAAFSKLDNTPVYPDMVDWSQLSADEVRFVQQEGPHNALGLIRIDMPNQDNVYMHDTPLKKLFNRNSRPFSSGCVRVQKIFDLASWLAKDVPGWSKGRLQEITGGSVPETIKLAQKVPVHFIYLTAWPDSKQGIQFRGDLYQKDLIGTVGSIQEREAMPDQGVAP